MNTASSGMTVDKPLQSDIVNTRYGDRQVIELPALQVFGEISGPNPDPNLTKAPRDAENPMLLSEYNNSGYKRINPNRPSSEPFNKRKYFQTGSTRPQQIQGYVSTDKKVHYYYDADGNPVYGTNNNNQSNENKAIRSSSNLVPNVMKNPKDYVLEATLLYGSIGSINMQASSIGANEIPDFLRDELKGAYGRFSVTHVRVECRSGEFYVFAKPEGEAHPQQQPYIMYMPQMVDHRWRELDRSSRPVYTTTAQREYTPYQQAPIYRQGYTAVPHPQGGYSHVENPFMRQPVNRLPH